MNLADRIYWLHALTPLHVGRGRGEGYIDLPLAREKVTNFPFVPGSSIKGVIADRHNASASARNELARVAFGAADDNEGKTGNAGALVFTDARLACLPVRSLYGTFAWCASPLVLRRLLRDLESANLHAGVKDFDAAPTDDCRVPNLASSALVADNRVFLEDLDLNAAACEITNLWAGQLAKWIFPEPSTWRDEFQRRFAVVPDDVFGFLSETGTEVQAHIKIEQKFKRVARGALWYEESLPAESILSGIVWCDRTAKDRRSEVLEEYCADTHLQIGGKATVGKGRVACVFTSGGSAS